MSPALVMISETSALINRSKYLTECIKYVVDQGFFPISKDINGMYIDLELMIRASSRIFLFTDYGVSTQMKEVIQSAIKREIEISYINMPDLSLFVQSSNPSVILSEVSAKTKIPVDIIKSDSQKREIVRARQFFCKRSRDLTSDSLAEIGSYINDHYDHATVLYSIRQVSNVYELSAWYDHYFNGGPLPREHERLNRREYSNLKQPKPIKANSEPLKPKMEATVYQKEDNRPCIGFQAFTGYRCHQV